MKLNDTILGGVVFALAAIVFSTSLGFPNLPGQSYGPGTFPMIIATTMAAAGLWMMVMGVRSRRPAIVVSDRYHRPGAWRRMAAIPSFVLLYILLSKPVGFPVLVPPLMAALLLVLGTRPIPAIAIALGATATFWMLFARVLLVPLPLGVLTEVIY